MFIPKVSIEDRQDVIVNAIRDIQLATLVTPYSGGINVSHIPAVVHEDGSGIILEMHVARANPHWKMIEDAAQSVAIFQGPHAYVSPSYYPSKKEHGKAVPTWNYIAVHAHGIIETFQDAEELLIHLEELTGNNEKDRTVPWHIDDAPEKYMEQMKRGIVGLRLKVEHFEGAWKIDQHKSTADRTGLAKGLRENGGENGIALADAIYAIKS
jgi:transcriptional regulator